MIKQCCNCAHADHPTKRSACNTKAPHEILNAEKMKYNGQGFQFCDDFKPLRKRDGK